MKHTHDDSALTFGCPACVQRVKDDQERTRWAEAPIRRCVWTFWADGEWYRFTADQRVPAGADADDVTEWYNWFGGVEPLEALRAAGVSLVDPETAGLIGQTLGCELIGQIVPDIQAPVADDTPSLFGALS